MKHVLTIDLEDWFHCLEPDGARWDQYSRRVEIGSRVVLDLLDEHRASATFFVLGDVAKHSPELVRNIAARGHEIGSHGSRHQFITRQSPDEFRADLRESLARLEDLIGTKVNAFRAPYFSITKRSLWALDILCEHGIVRDSSVFPVRNHRYGIPDAPTAPYEIRPGLVEWPITVLPTRLGNIPFAGGVYFRWLPSVLIRHCFQTVAGRGDPVVFYLHPWELDPDHPRHLTSPLLFLRHYGRLSGTKARLAALMSEHRFTSLAGAAS